MRILQLTRCYHTNFRRQNSLFFRIYFCYCFILLLKNEQDSGNGSECFLSFGSQHFFSKNRFCRPALWFYGRIVLGESIGKHSEMGVIEPNANKNKCLQAGLMFGGLKGRSATGFDRLVYSGRTKHFGPTMATVPGPIPRAKQPNLASHIKGKAIPPLWR